jgi:SET family sugar efflux transporter-like MFS transporter
VPTTSGGSQYPWAAARAVAVACSVMGVETAAGEHRTARRLIPLGLVTLTAGLSTAIVMPFLALFLSDEVEAGPARVTVFLVASPLASVVMAWLLGRLSDRHPIRRALLVGASVAGVVGCALTAFVRDYYVLLGLTVTATALAASLFPQSFAYARQVLQRDDPARAAMGISTLRTVFSLAWVAGPPLAAVLLEVGGFAYLYGLAAVMYAIAALVAVRWMVEITDPDDPAGKDEPLVRRPWMAWLATAAFVLMQTPLVLAVQALPLFLTRELDTGAGAAGLILGLCAALEIPLMLGFGWLSTRRSLRSLILFGGACGVAYYALAAVSGSVWILVAGQVLNATFIAAVSGLGISYMQDMLPREPGRATTLFTNTFPIGAMLAGPLFGISQSYGFRLAYAMSAALCFVGLLVLISVRRARVVR